MHAYVFSDAKMEVMSRLIINGDGIYDPIQQYVSLNSYYLLIFVNTRFCKPDDCKAVHEEDAVVQRHERQIDEGRQRPDDPVRLHDPPELPVERAGSRL